MRVQINIPKMKRKKNINGVYSTKEISTCIAKGCKRLDFRIKEIERKEQLRKWYGRY